MDTKDKLERTFGNLFDASCGDGGCSIKKPAPQLTFSQQMRQKYSFKAVHNSIMSGIMNHVISWIMACFNKYDERTFHAKMGGVFHYRDQVDGKEYTVRGFDFIADWNKNHPNRYGTIIKVIRKTGVQLDRDRLNRSVEETIKNHGWQLHTEEAICLRIAVLRLYNILYSNTDSVKIGLDVFK